VPACAGMHGPLVNHPPDPEVYVAPALTSNCATPRRTGWINFRFRGRWVLFAEGRATMARYRAASGGAGPAGQPPDAGPQATPRSGPAQPGPAQQPDVPPPGGSWQPAPVQPEPGQPQLQPGQAPGSETGPVPVSGGTGQTRHHVIKRTRIGGVWLASALFALVLLLLLIFILENGHSVDISYFGMHGHLPLGVALLLAAVLGVLLVVIPGTGRIIQLRMTARRHRRIDAQAGQAGPAQAGPAQPGPVQPGPAQPGPADPASAQPPGPSGRRPPE
jgi:lipopolysaccharide assembly protein A